MRPSQKKLCTGQNDGEPDDAEDEIEVKCGGGERPADSRRTKVRHRGPGERKKCNERRIISSADKKAEKIVVHSPQLDENSKLKGSARSTNPLKATAAPAKAHNSGRRPAIAQNRKGVIGT